MAAPKASFADTFERYFEVTGNPSDTISQPDVYKLLGESRKPTPKKLIKAAVILALKEGITPALLDGWTSTQRRGLDGSAENGKGVHVFRGVRLRSEAVPLPRAVLAAPGVRPMPGLPQAPLDDSSVMDALKSQLPDEPGRVELFSGSCLDKDWATCYGWQLDCFRDRENGLRATYLKHCWRASVTAVRFKSSDRDVSTGGTPAAVVTAILVTPRPRSYVVGKKRSLEDIMADATGRLEEGSSVVYLPLILAHKNCKGEGRKLVFDLFSALQRIAQPPPLHLLVNPPPGSQPLMDMYQSSAWGFSPLSDGYLIHDAKPASPAAAGTEPRLRYQILPRTYHECAFVDRKQALFTKVEKTRSPVAPEGSCAPTTPSSTSGKRKRDAKH
jgi:hypothetical protein